jgi:hypothetical protein
MTIDDRIEELRKLVGVNSQPDLRPTRVVAFELSPDGALILTTADGDTLTCAEETDLPPGYHRSDEKVGADAFELLMPGCQRDRVPRGVRFYRSTIILCDGTRADVFREAGR